ncbi:NAD(P)H-hydrate dehydratase [Helicobacter apodemus]|uniref:Bifunctional NAD(P)H-hydrate repair enzyme n=1 Tax=Helicobacter apodemus TaxID=135569 RepID=A0A2U8FDQ9_9HELI|nr:NAD(P)H-hydrate dehydratase [Helicobacter apodemus]AWI34303.1 bifunctional ADP-dependent NAD(P)H-hydrate dehydratase/NAD(P)H-hydrate epimerase [Helicobacter apodemus]
MKKLFTNTSLLDKNAIDKFYLSPEILMENAARGMREFMLPFCKEDSKILFVCGSGDNGADCLALARMLCGRCKITILLPLALKSRLALLQFQRLKSLESHCELNFIQTLEHKEKFDIIVDGIFGIGFRGELPKNLENLLLLLNQMQALKIACDIPSGIDKAGNPRFIQNKPLAFRANFTLTMGALKTGLFSDYAKDFVGDILLLHLGIEENLFTPNSPFHLLEEKDFKPPLRETNNCNKGDFGHLSIFIGEKGGAGILAALAGFRIGAGLVSIIGECPNCPIEIMQTKNLPANTTAILLGMGYGRKSPSLIKTLQPHNEIPLLLDADMFYHEDFKAFLKNFTNLILTPHPKEFIEILKQLNNQEISIAEVQKNRIPLALEFSQNYPNTTLVLKGANTLLAKKGEVFINPLGTNTLAKGGSGDVLAGIIGGYLAQGYDCLEACIQGILTHNLCAKKFATKNANFALSPLDLIEQIRYI